MLKKSKKPDLSGVVRNKKLPILTLDNRWHELFPDDKKNTTMRELEQKVNNLLKRQGKLVNDIKDMKQLKSNLLKDIVDNMDLITDSSGRAKEKKLDKNKKYINEINEKLEAYSDELADLPYQIKLVNEELMAQSMQVLYQQMEKNRVQINEISDWIANIREELKSKILLKQDMETRNSLIYSYMHDILGAEVMELFDKEISKGNDNQ